MNPQQTTKISRFLSLVLRHQPETIGITLAEDGWTNVDELIAAMNKHGQHLDFETLELVVETNDKKRFAFSDDGEMIRANQGHSVEVNLGYQPTPPPEILYHGTVARFLPSIREGGIQKGQRHQVHLSVSLDVANTVGKRRGQPVILTVRAREMNVAGHDFYISTNGVWLTDFVPAAFIDFEE
ncbi:MAG: RNA 2'-phosphotransferase [Luteolibacter sp.]|uniref:RNA 2'-phosphotransferase n=1 Tax=Luteolibacter sp. TaxID=1962973 RepID=UPI00326598EC